MRVQTVVAESPDTASLYLGGPQIAHVKAEAGQFFLLRVLKPGLWWQTHPYSLSAAPTDQSLRFTVKQLGDASETMTASCHARTAPGRTVRVRCEPLGTQAISGAVDHRMTIHIRLFGNASCALNVWRLWCSALRATHP